MSLLPYLWEGELYPRRRRQVPFQHFALDLQPEDVMAEMAPIAMFPSDYLRPWRHLAAAARDLGSSVQCDKDKVQFNLDVQQFKPDEISVKTADGFIVVEGKHEEKRDDHGYVSRQFVRRYALPEGCHVDKVESKLSSDGVLTVVAPRESPPVEGGRDVQIQRTGPVRVGKAKEEKKKEEKKGEKKEDKDIMEQ